jgi:5,6,7,8-tetrahydromethanopterin hydro-lyase
LAVKTVPSAPRSQTPWRDKAKAVADSVADGVIPQKDAEDLVIVCGVFIHPAAEDDKKIYDFNYEATKQSIAAAMKGQPSVKEMLAGKDAAKHPFRGF